MKKETIQAFKEFNPLLQSEIIKNATEEEKIILQEAIKITNKYNIGKKNKRGEACLHGTSNNK